MNQYALLFNFIAKALLQISPALIVLALLSVEWVNPRTAYRFRAALFDFLVGGSFMGLGFLIVVAFLIRGVGPFPGAVMGAVYLVFRDGLLTGMSERRSIGKKVMRLRLICRTPGRTFVNVTVLRNLVLGCVALIGINRPWARMIINVVVIFEALMVWLNPRGMRIGDYIANTRVISRKRHTKNRRGSKGDDGQKLRTPRMGDL